MKNSLSLSTQKAQCADQENIIEVSRQIDKTNDQDSSLKSQLPEIQTAVQSCDKEQRQQSINSQFERYEQKQHKRTHKNTMHKRQQLSLSNNTIQSSNPAPAQTIDTYKEWKVYKNKSNINMLPFPYCLEQTIQTKRATTSPLSLFNLIKNHARQACEPKAKPNFMPALYKLKVHNKVQVYNHNMKQNKIYKPYFNYQKTPINEYLNYDLSEDINAGLRQVQIMAEQIKRIKKSKQMVSQNIQIEKGKQNKGIRIRRSYIKNHKGLYKSEADISKV